MGPFRTAHSPSKQGAALLIVLAMVVLFTGLAVAYLSRTTSDRQVAHSSFNQSKVDQLAASAMDLIIGDLQNEIARGSSPTPTPTCNVSATPPCNPAPTGTPTPIPTPPSCTPTVTPFVYFPTAAANILPVQWPTTTPNTTPIPNLIRVSKRGDEPGGTNPIPTPGVPSHGSAVNSSSPTEASANGRYVKLPRWNKHYLIPRPSPTPATDTSPIPDFSPAPDWVILTRNGPVAFNTWCPVLADSTQSNNFYCVGRYAYAIYDEAGLLDANVAGFPSNTTAAQYGPKGVSSFADLTALGLTQPDIDAIVGWRNYFSAGGANGPGGAFPNFNFSAAAATNYVNSVLSNTNGFMTVPVPSSTPNNMSNTDQQFTTRQSLINLLVNSGLSNADVVAGANALQYLGTFSRELNAPSYAPVPNASPDMGAPNNGPGNVYAYGNNAANPSATPINPNLLNVTVQNSFTRADGNTANVGEPLIDRRFPLTRINGLADPTFPATAPNSTIVNGVPSPASATTVQRDFGLLWNSTSNRWDYVGPTGSAVQPKIETLWQVATEQREPNFFELLKAVILNGSVGMGSGSGNTFVAAQLKYYDNTGSSGPTSSDYQIMQIGANIINQWDSGNVPIFFNFYDSTGNYELAGIKNLPYFNKLVFEPSWTTVHGGGPYQFDAWLLPSLWNPHQNAASATGTVQVAMTSGALSAMTTSPNITTSSIVASPTPISMTVNANAFATPSAPTSAGSIVGSITKSPDGYYGFHISPTPSPTASPDNNLATAYPYFGSTGCTFELQIQVNGSWKTYERWQTYASPSPSPVVCQSPPAPKRWLDRGSNNALQDPEFVALDPRTLRFGVWANAAIASGTPSDYTSGTQTSLDVSANPSPSPGTFEKITALGPNGPQFFASPSPTPTLYLYAFNTDTAVYYTDLDGVERRGDPVTSGNTSVMQPANSSDRPLVLAGAFQNGVFQSVAELGHVFRDQPWKTISFGAAASSPSPYPAASPYPTPRSADAGLLDVFTLHESTMDAGKTSLNTRQAPVLKAILSKAALNLKGTSIITATQIDDGNGHGIVPALKSLTNSQPMVNKAELVTRLAADSNVISLGNKEARDCVMRAFSDAGQTRTWNLLIDLIAQSGRYPSNASSLAGFVVEGEQHYWIHVAIDRFTGEVIDKQVEVVNE